MCFPAVAAVAGIAGSLISAAGSIYSGKAAAAASKAQAQAYEVQAHNAFSSGEYEAGKTRDQANKIMGSQIAGYAENGVSLNGSPSDVIGSTASDAEMDKAAIRWSARSQADNLVYQAKIERMNAKAQQTGGYLGAAASVIGGISKLTRLGQPYGSTA